MFMISNEEGAKTTLYCATSDATASDNGLYYDECKPKKVNKVAFFVNDSVFLRFFWNLCPEILQDVIIFSLFYKNSNHC